MLRLTGFRRGMALRAQQQLSLFHDLLRPAQTLSDVTIPASHEAGTQAPQQPLEVTESTPVYAHPQANRVIELPQCSLSYLLTFKRRQTIMIYVEAQGVSVSAPRWAGQAQIEAFLREKASWLVRKLVEQREEHSRRELMRICWENGGELDYMGYTVVLRVSSLHKGVVPQKDDQGRTTALSVGLSGREANINVLHDAVQAWMRQQARTLFEARCAYYAPRMEVMPSAIRLSSAKTRWGSASANGHIQLHWRLVELPLELVDYVVVHELAHLRVMNHSPRFWAVVEEQLPDYRARRKALKTAVMRVW